MPGLIWYQEVRVTYIPSLLWPPWSRGLNTNELSDVTVGDDHSPLYRLHVMPKNINFSRSKKGSDPNSRKRAKNSEEAPMEMKKGISGVEVTMPGQN